MDAIHIIMSTSNSANPHNFPNERIENIVRKRKISAITFLVFGVLLIVAGSLLASFESQRFSASFIIFGVIGLIFAFMYWISAEKILIALRKFNLNRMRLAQSQSQNSGELNIRNINNGDVEGYITSNQTNLPTYEQSVLPHTEIPPPYDEAIKIRSADLSNSNSSQQSSTIPIHSISLSVDQAASAITTTTSEQLSKRKQSTSN